jgi:hypothetical protein
MARPTENFNLAASSDSTRRRSIARIGIESDRFGAVAGIALLVAASVASLFAPQAGQLLALTAAMLCAAYLRPLLPAAILVFVHAGSVIFASRALETESSDFAVYHELFVTICTGSAPLAETLFSFGAEIGLPVLYKILSFTGACSLSINGLAYVQALFVSMAILWLLCSTGSTGRTPGQSAMIVGGTMALFSFVYVTQLSRQTISSAFLLWLLVDRRSSISTAGALLTATIFHLTAPLIYGLACLMRSTSRVGMAILGLLCLGIYAMGNEVLSWAIERSDAFDGFAKLMYYATEVDTNESVGSDLRALAYLLAAGLASLSLKRIKSPESAPDARMLLGFAALAAVLLPLPLAATRLTLAFSALGIGFYLFSALTLRYPRLAVFALISALIFKSGLFSITGPADHEMWLAFPNWSFYPLYYVAAF